VIADRSAYDVNVRYGIAADRCQHEDLFIYSFELKFVKVPAFSPLVAKRYILHQTCLKK